MTSYHRPNSRNSTEKALITLSGSNTVSRAPEIPREITGIFVLPLSSMSGSRQISYIRVKTRPSIFMKWNMP
jgi:hypothetical protein